MSPPPPAPGRRPGSGGGPSRPGSGTALPTAIIAEKWRVTRFLGAGSFGHVFAGENIHDPSAPVVALKRALTQSDKPTNQPSVGVDYLAAELAGLRQITAAGGAPDSLPKLFSDELIETPRGLIMVMSCHGPALASVKKALMVARMGGNEWGVSEMTASDKVVPGMGLDVEVVVEIGRQLAETLDWIHKQGLVYCDMKLANIVLRHPNPPFTLPDFPADIVLIDHGLIRPIKPPLPNQQTATVSSVGAQPNEPQRNDRIGTPRYASISMHRGHPPTPSSDFESLAYTLFDLTLSHLPWTKVDAKPGPATWQAISRAKSHMTEHEWSILLGERDPNAPSARFANTLISLWDAAHLARPRYAGRFNWEQVFDDQPPRQVALWKGVPAHVLEIVDKELAHAHAVAEREAGFLSPSASRLDSWGMPVVVKEAKVMVVSDPWGAAAGGAGAGDVPPPNAAPSSVSSRGGGSGWDDTWAVAGSSSHGSAGWGAPSAPADRDDGSNGGWGAAADAGWRSGSGRAGSGRGTARGGRPASGSDRGHGRGPHALQQEMSTQQEERGQAGAAYVWEQPASPTWDQPRQSQRREPAAAARRGWDADAWGDQQQQQQQQPSRSSPGGGAGRWGDQRGGDQRGAAGDGWNQSGGRGNRQQGGDQRGGNAWDRSSGRGGNRLHGGDQRGGDGWDRSSGRSGSGGGNDTRQQGGSSSRWGPNASQDARRPGSGSGSDARGQRPSSGWSGTSNRPANGGWGGEQGEQEDDGWGQNSSSRSGSGRGGRSGGGNRGWPR